MSQKTLTSFFAATKARQTSATATDTTHKRARDYDHNDHHHDEDDDNNGKSGSNDDNKDTTAPQPALKRPRESASRRSASRSASPSSATAFAAQCEAYYAEHADELDAMLRAQPPPTVTSMAKLVQAAELDPYVRFAAVWPQPPRRAAGASAAPTASDTVQPQQQQDDDVDDVVPYAAVVDTLADISATGSRLECVLLLTQLLHAVLVRCPRDLVPVIYLVINKQAPAHEGVELGVGDALLKKVIAECCGMTEAQVRTQYKKCGDLAEVAQNNKQKQSTLLKPTALSARSVFDTFCAMARMSGKDVVRRRADAIRRLLTCAVGAEVNLLVRSLQQMMRIGLAESSALAAVGYAFALHHIGAARARDMDAAVLQTLLQLAASSLARSYHEVPSLELVCGAVLRHGFMVLMPGSRVAVAHATELSLRPGLPVKPQLAHPTSGIHAILERLQGKQITCEYKYDGERAQIHYCAPDNKDSSSSSSSDDGGGGGGVFSIFSRNAETHTGKYPDVLAMLPLTFDRAEVRSFIVDAELVAVDAQSGALQAFQVLQHRGRKNIALEDVTIPVCVFAFDLLYYNGTSLLSRPLRERRALLQRTFAPRPGQFAFAAHLDSEKDDDIQHFLDRAIADGCEGLMVKTLDDDAAYTPARRSRAWLKLKKDYIDGATDTFDLVPIGAYHGRGKRAGVFGGFLLACYDPDSEEYQSVCKISTGFDDSDFERLTQQLLPYVVTQKPRYYRASGDLVDVWLVEAQVWEVKAADLSVSPVHCAALGLVDAARGVALRFPRFIRVRDDKAPSDCTTAQQVAEMYKAQSLAVHQERDMDDE